MIEVIAVSALAYVLFGDNNDKKEEEAPATPEESTCHCHCS
jgi:hypothetical protein